MTSLRATLDSRYDDLESGRVEPIDGEDALARLRRRGDTFSMDPCIPTT